MLILKIAFFILNKRKKAPNFRETEKIQMIRNFQWNTDESWVHFILEQIFNIVQQENFVKF